MEERVKKFLDRVGSTAGYVYPFHKFLAEEDYEWAESFQSWYEQIRAEKWLPLKYKELLFVTASLSQRFERGVRTHIKKALELGATKQEILETIEVASHTCGGGTLVLGIRCLMEAIEGKPVPESPTWIKEK